MKSYKALCPVLMGLFTYYLISSFLSGEIIDIPHGTHKAGIVAATGTGIIMIFMVVVGFIFFKLTRKKVTQ